MTQHKGCPMSGAAAQGGRGGADGWHGAQMDFAKDMSYGDYLARPDPQRPAPARPTTTR